MPPTPDRPRAIRIKHTALLAALVLASAVAAAAIGQIPRVRALEAALLDMRAVSLAPAVQDPRIVVLAIGEDTLARFPYRSPIDRRFLADLVTRLRQAGVRMIGFDVLVDQPTEPAADAALKATLAAEGAPAIVVSADGRLLLTPRQQAYHLDFLNGLKHGVAFVEPDSFDQVVRQQEPDGPDGLSLAGMLAEEAGVAVPAGEFPGTFRRGQGQTSPFPVYPAEAAAVLPDAWLKDRIALIGVVLPDADRHLTPLRFAGDSTGTPGILIHAQFLAQLLDHSQLRTPGFAAGLGLTVAAAGLGALPALWAVGLALALWWLVAFAAPVMGWPLLPLVAPSLAMVGATASCLAWRGREERKQRHFIRNAFAKFLAPTVVARLEADPLGLKLGGERREISVLFTDLAGFTPLTEQLAPEDLTALLNRYFDGLVEQVMAHEGTIDKYVGDALHVMFGAPGDQADHAERAVETALAIDRFAEAFRREQAREGKVVGVTRIGLHTGPAVVGNFGGTRRFDYTAYGSVVNLTARLEQANKRLGTRICASADIVALCPAIRFRPVAELALRGVATPLAVFQPVTAGTDPSAWEAAWQALVHERDDAEMLLAPLATTDAVAALHLARLRRGEKGVRLDLSD